MSIVLLAVPFEYVRYVGHLSKWFVFVLMFKFWSVCRLWNGRPTIGYNGLRLQEVGDFGDENCLPPLNLIRSTKLHLTTEPPISCRCCYHQCFLVCRGLYVLFCLLSFVFLSCGGAFFKISFSLGLALQALLKTLVCAVFKCACKMRWH